MTNKVLKDGIPPVWNTFCPTGEGGGIDPTCKGSGGGGGGKNEVGDKKPEWGKGTLPGYGPVDVRQKVWDKLKNMSAEEIDGVMVDLGFDPEDYHGKYQIWNIMSDMNDEDDWSYLTEALEL